MYVQLQGIQRLDWYIDGDSPAACPGGFTRPGSPCLLGPHGPWGPIITIHQGCPRMCQLGYQQHLRVINHVKIPHPDPWSVVDLVNETGSH